MKALVFLNSLTLGGTEKAACLWSGYLAERILQRGRWSSDLRHVSALSLADGPRRADLERMGVPLRTLDPRNPPSETKIAEAISHADVIHAHAPGVPHQGDILGLALHHLGKKIPVVQTNIFGKLQNAPEDAWTDFRLFISWASCVQAARRAKRKLDREFFRRQSVAVYPVQDPFDEKRARLILESQTATFREKLGLLPKHVLFGRFSRPEPNKWSHLALKAFLSAYRKNRNLRLLLREPPSAIARELYTQGLALSPNERHRAPQELATRPVLILPAVAEPDELAISQMACQAILHTSSIGESFGYGLAEPMALGKAVITNSVPWHDQAQIELARHRECGLTASTENSIRDAILLLAGNEALRIALGETARTHILGYANPETSVDRIEMALQCARSNTDNPHCDEDLETALQTARYLDIHQWGHSFGEMAYLHTLNVKRQFRIWRHKLLVPTLS